MSGDVSTFLKILKSVNNLKSKAKSEDNDQSIPKDLVTFEGEYIYCFFENR